MPVRGRLASYEPADRKKQNCKQLPECMWTLRLKPQESQSFASCSSGSSLCSTPWEQLRWHPWHEWMKPGVDMGFSCGICRNMALGKGVFTSLTGASSLVLLHRNCLFFGESSPLLCDVITQGAGVSRLQMLLTRLCNENTLKFCSSGTSCPLSCNATA